MKDALMRTPQQIADDFEKALKAVDGLFLEASEGIDQLDPAARKEFRKLRRKWRRMHADIAECADEVVPDDQMTVLGGGT